MNLLTQKQNVSEQVVSPNKTNEENKTQDKNNNKSSAKKENAESDKNQSLLSFNDVTDSSYIKSDNYQVLKEELIAVKNIYVKTHFFTSMLTSDPKLITVLTSHCIVY